MHPGLDDVNVERERERGEIDLSPEKGFYWQETETLRIRKGFRRTYEELNSWDRCTDVSYQGKSIFFLSSQPTLTIPAFRLVLDKSGTVNGREC